jgi:tetratricopeptide (TPR) repeat protein
MRTGGLNLSGAAVALIVTAIAVSVYIPSLSGGFAWEVAGPAAGGGEDAKYFPFFDDSHDRPLADASARLDARLWGPNPAGYHLTNVLLHGINTLLVFLLAARVMGNHPATVLAGLLFALHPVNTEAVSWISARPELLLTLFFISCFLCFIYYLETGRPWALAAGGLFLLLSALSGRVALMFPVLGLAWAAAKGEDINRRRLAVALLFSAFVIAAWLFISAGGGLPLPGEALLQRLGHVASCLGYYMEKLAVPQGLSIVPAVQENPLYTILAVLPFALAALLYSEGAGRGAFLIAWILITLFPSLLVVLWNVDNPLSERYLYLPSAGFCLLLALPLAAFGNRKRLLAVAAVPLLLFYLIGTLMRVGVWRDDLAVWEDALKKNPGSSLVRLNLGVALMREGLHEKALEEFSLAAVQKDINPAKLLHIIELYASSGTDFQAVEERLLTNLVAAKGEEEGHSSMGILYHSLAKRRDGDREFYGKATRYLQKAVELSPDMPEPHFYLGECYMALREWERAEGHLGRVLQIENAADATRLKAKESLKIIGMLREAGLIGTQ